MATRTVYITVRLDIDNSQTGVITDEDVNNILSEMDYDFTAPAGDFIIYDTEICGTNN